MIFHLALRLDWEAAQLSFRYPWSTRNVRVADSGFVHCSFDHQWLEVRRRFYDDVSDEDLVLLAIDEGKLTHPLIVEQLSGAPEAFPHIYGELEIEAVVEVRPVVDSQS